jgi:hypothetical protein
MFLYLQDVLCNFLSNHKENNCRRYLKENERRIRLITLKTLRKIVKLEEGNN